MLPPTALFRASHSLSPLLQTPRCSLSALLLLALAPPALCQTWRVLPGTATPAQRIPSYHPAQQQQQQQEQGDSRAGERQSSETSGTPLPSREEATPRDRFGRPSNEILLAAPAPAPGPEYVRLATQSPFTTSVRLADGGEVTTTRSVTAEVPLTQVAQAFDQQAAVPKTPASKAQPAPAARPAPHLPPPRLPVASHPPPSAPEPVESPPASPPAAPASPPPAAQPLPVKSRGHPFHPFRDAFILLLWLGLFALCSVALLRFRIAPSPDGEPRSLGDALLPLLGSLKQGASYGTAQAAAFAFGPREGGWTEFSRQDEESGQARRRFAEDAAPEEYMLRSLSSRRPQGAASLSLSPDTPRHARSPKKARHKKASQPRGSAAAKADGPEAWELLYARAPDASTAAASELLKSLGKGRKALVERSWLAGESGALSRGAAAMPKLSLGCDKAGVWLSWSEGRFGAASRVTVHSARAALSTPVIRLQTSAGEMAIQPPGGTSEAEAHAGWVLGLNSAFHSSSVARAAASGVPGEWAVGKEELGGAAISLPWHPAVFLDGREGGGGREEASVLDAL